MNDTYLEKISVLREIKRYNNTFCLKTESVAEHSFFVAAIILNLYNEYNFDLKKALIMGLIHDFPECEITDIQHNVKEQFPFLKKKLKIAEKKVMMESFLELFKYYRNFSKEDKVETIIVKYADVLSCYQYSSNEIGMGNIGYMTEVREGSISRLVELQEKLKDSKR